MLPHVPIRDYISNPKTVNASIRHIIGDKTITVAKRKMIYSRVLSGDFSASALHIIKPKRIIQQSCNKSSLDEDYNGYFLVNLFAVSLFEWVLLEAGLFGAVGLSWDLLKGVPNNLTLFELRGTKYLNYEICCHSSISLP